MTTEMLDDFPWAEALPAAERAQFAADLAEVLNASAKLGRRSPAQVIKEWRSTAAIHTDPVLATRLTGPIEDDLGLVPPPTADTGRRGSPVADPDVR
jgi:hypothetical protein